MFTNLSSDVRNNPMTALQEDAKLRVGQGLRHFALNFHRLFFCHTAGSLRRKQYRHGNNMSWLAEVQDAREPAMRSVGETIPGGCLPVFLLGNGSLSQGESCIRRIRKGLPSRDAELVASGMTIKPPLR